MDIVIQIWGASFYLCNKIFFALAEGKSAETKRKMKLIGWTVYILGVPAWVIILVSNHNWIAASVESGGIPSMLLGLLTVYYRGKTPSRILSRTASLSVYFFLAIGIAYSLYDFGGLTSITQVLEIFAMGGFLVGSYLLAKDSINGWLFFMVMNLSVAVLMLIQEKELLALQQIASLSFVIYGYAAALRHNRKVSA